MITKFKKRREDVYTPLWLPVLDFDYVAWTILLLSIQSRMRKQSQIPRPLREVGSNKFQSHRMRLITEYMLLYTVSGV
jgi:hypothetical protein